MLYTDASLLIPSTLTFTLLLVDLCSGDITTLVVVIISFVAIAMPSLVHQALAHFMSICQYQSVASITHGIRCGFRHTTGHVDFFWYCHISYDYRGLRALMN